MAASGSDAVPDDGLGELFHAVARRLRRAYVNGLEPFGISPHHARALRIVVHDGPMRLGELADALRVAPRSVTDVVDALEASGWVVREPDSRDRRAVVVRATSDGARLAHHAEAVRRGQAEGYFERLTPSERSALEQILRHLLATY